MARRRSTSELRLSRALARRALARRRALDLKRRLMRAMARLPWRQAELIAVAVREQAAAVAFSEGRSIDNLCNDIDQGAAWDRGRMETAIRNRFTARR